MPFFLNNKCVERILTQMGLRKDANFSLGTFYNYLFFVESQ